MLRLFVAMLMVLPFVPGLGCRQPGIKMLMKSVTPPSTTLVYDTAQEQEIFGQAEPPRDSFAYDYRWRYRDSLSEPVTLVGWEEGVASQWKILYATNREPVADTRSGRTQTFGNRYKVHPEYGMTGVTLPHREPGEDPAVEQKPSAWQSLIPAVWRKQEEEPEPSGEQLVSLSDPAPMTAENFFQEVRSQVSQSRQRDVLVFVHGFNVSFEAAVIRTAQIAADLPFNGAVISYSWPSQGGVDNYKTDGKIVDESVGAFAEFLRDLGTQLPPDVRINIVVHSMGNRLVLRALQQMPASFASPKRFANIVFCAPDVGVSEFKQKVPAAVAQAKRVTLYTCENDAALNASWIVNGEDRAGAPQAPLVIDGVDTIECVVVETSLLGHSYYGSNPALLRDLFQIVKEDIPPAERKWLKEHKLPFGMGTYWIFAGFPVNLEWVWHPGAEESSGRVRVAN